ncbi:MAG: hypothetical protein IPM64_06915 [Phycisphaerales bacterium]|nr:hypothetical protein [Phycisphaerales bacterium]
MRTLVLTLAALGALTTGCGGRQRAEVFNGFMDVVADRNDYRVLAGSDVIRLQVVGSRNRIVFEDDAVLAELYIIGRDNYIELPPGIHPYGEWRSRGGNTIVNRPPPPVPDVDEYIREYRLRLLIESAPDSPQDSAPTTAPAGDGE